MTPAATQPAAASARHTARRRPAISFGRAATLALLAGAAAATGCREQDETEAAVARATSTLSTDVRTASFEQAAGEARDAAQAAGQDRRNLATAAAIVESVAAQRAADDEARAFAAAIDTARAPLAPARHELARYGRFQAEAIGLLSDDATPEIARLEAQADDLLDRADERGAELRGLRRRADELAEQIGSMREQAAALRERAAVAEADAATGSAADAARAAVEIRRLVREADALDLDASTLRLEADTLDRTITEAETRIDELSEQRRLSRAAIESIDEGREEAAALAAGLRAQAADSAEAFADAAGRAVAAADGEVSAALDALVSALQRSARAASGAGGLGQSAARLAAANAERRVGEAHESAALLHADIASVMTDAALAVPPLPDRARYAELAERFADDAESARLEAADRLSRAASGLRSGASGPSRDGLEAAADALDARAEALRPERAGAEDDSEPAEFTTEDFE